MLPKLHKNETTKYKLANKVLKLIKCGARGKGKKSLFFICIFFWVHFFLTKCLPAYCGRVSPASQQLRGKDLLIDKNLKPAPGAAF